MLNQKPLWLILPIALSLLLFSVAYHDYFFTSVCLFAIIIPVLLKSNISITTWPQPRILAAIAITTISMCSVYYAIFLSQKGYIGLTIVGLLSVVATVVVWHLNTNIKLKTDLLLALSITITCASVSAYSADSPSFFFYALLILFSLVTLLIFAYLGGGLKFQDKRFIAQHVAIALFSIFAVAIATYTIRSSIGHIERRLFLMVAEGDLFKTTSFSDPIGVVGDMNIPRQSNLQLSSEIVASISDRQTEKYLRTQVLTQYSNGKWLVPSSTNNHDKKLHYFELLDKTLTSPNQTQITLYGDLHGAVPLPALTQEINSPNDISFIPANGLTLRCIPSQNLKQYNLKKAIKLPSQPLLDSAEIKDPQASTEILKALHPLAEEITKNNVNSPLAAAKSIQDYFQANYTYSLKVELKPKDVDPIVDFVLNRRPAYCKYYASGMVLMLKSLGIPARVVCGFFAKEYNPISKEWVVRNRDAHVWCEVYDNTSQQWVSFDPTPPTALEMQVEKGFIAQLTQWLELLKLHLSDFLIASFYKLYNWLPANINTVIVVIVLFVLAKIGIRFRSKIISLIQSLYKPKQAILTTNDTTPITVKLARKELEQIANVMAQHKLPITEAETPTEYLQRLKAEFDKRTDFQPHLSLLEEFFQLYQELRFRPVSTDQQIANSLSQITDQITNIFSASK